MYESLERLPGTTRDRYGNLNLVDGNTGNGGLRKHFEYLLALDGAQMAGTVLCDLLDWLRWGSETGVMWECTLPELISLIDKWSAANPNAPLELFTRYFTKEVNWDELWSERGMKGEMRRKRKCGCGRIFTEFHDCNLCHQRWHEMKQVYIGPRGEGTYYLVLQGADGGSVAAAVWSRHGQPLTSPRGFEERNHLYPPSSCSEA